MHTKAQTHNLCLPEDVRAQFLAFFQNAQGLFRWDVDLQGGGQGGVDKAVNDGRNLLLDGEVVTVGMTEVLHTKRERLFMIKTKSSYCFLKVWNVTGLKRIILDRKSVFFCCVYVSNVC